MRDLDKATFYAPQPDEMRAIAPHAARLSNWLVDKVHIPDGAVELLFNTNDIIEVCYIVVGYLYRIGVLENMVPWLDKKFEKVREDLAKGTEEVVSGSNASVSNAASNGHASDFDIGAIPGLGAQYRTD